jgi:hypothetical protein
MIFVHKDVRIQLIGRFSRLPVRFESVKAA